MKAARAKKPARARETAEARKARALKLIAALKKRWPDATCTLDYSGPLQLLVATILSAQCTDERVNRETPAIFAMYRTARDYAAAPLPDLEKAFQRTGFFRNKAKSVQGAAKAIVERFGGEVPPRMEDLVTLPGVGRKTANVVLGNAFDITSGVVVDTHVSRLAGRLGLSKETDPEKIERDLMPLVPQSDWIKFGHMLIMHGRNVCQARKPKCAECSLSALCPSAFKV